MPEQSMGCFESQMQWIDSQASRMRALLIDWCNVNSGSYNAAGLETMLARLKDEYSELGGEAREVALDPHRVTDDQGNLAALPLGRALVICKRPEAARRVLLGIHMDTVYGPDDPFQRVTELDANRLRGPGVTDAKGGLVIMLIALAAFERSDVADRIGWEVIINPDEEIGSPGSAGLLAEAAGRNHVGLLFEPALPNGALVSERKGSGNFTVVARGKSAHAGRDFHAGRNAIVALSRFVTEVARPVKRHGEVTINVGRIVGGGAVNVVPDTAVCRLNVRYGAEHEQAVIESHIERALHAARSMEGIIMELSGGFTAPPKLLSAPMRRLLEQAKKCGDQLGIAISWGKSGGVSDGNRLAAGGLVCLDTLGPRGGNIHSPDEFIIVESLVERAKLAALMLMSLAAGETEFPPPM